MSGNPFLIPVGSSRPKPPIPKTLWVQRERCGCRFNEAKREYEKMCARHTLEAQDAEREQTIDWEAMVLPWDER